MALKASIYIPAVGKVTILMLLRNLYVGIDHVEVFSPILLNRLRLQQYQQV